VHSSQRKNCVLVSSSKFFSSPQTMTLGVFFFSRETFPRRLSPEVLHFFIFFLEKFFSCIFSLFFKIDIFLEKEEKVVIIKNRSCRRTSCWGGDWKHRRQEIGFVDEIISGANARHIFLSGTYILPGGDSKRRHRFFRLKKKIVL